MPIVESRVRQGVLTIDTSDFSCQPTAVSIQPANAAGGAGTELEVLCGDKLTDSGSAADFSANLAITAIQDFTNSAGLIALSWVHNGETLDFTWQPTSQAADTWTGKVTVQALQTGGTVGERLTTDATWPITELFLPARLGGGQVIPAPVVTTPITGVTAGMPGTWQPGTATPPADLAALKVHSVVGDAGSAKPGAAWTNAQYITLGDGSSAYWDGSAWVQGIAP